MVAQEKTIPTYAEVAGYKELADLLLEEIENGVYGPGSQMPTEMEISRRFGLNRHTVRAALRRLVQDGYIYRVRGRGTFVARRKIPYSLWSGTRFSTTISALGLTPGAKVVHSYRLQATRDLAHHLEITEQDRVVVLEILRTINEVPSGYTHSYVPAARFPRLEERAERASSLYKLFQETYGVKAIHRARSEIEVGLPTEADTKHLQISDRVPVLDIRSLACDEAGTPLEYCVTRSRGDMVRLTVKFQTGGAFNA